MLSKEQPRDFYCFLGQLNLQAKNTSCVILIWPFEHFLLHISDRVSPIGFNYLYVSIIKCLLWKSKQSLVVSLTRSILHRSKFFQSFRNLINYVHIHWIQTVANPNFPQTMQTKVKIDALVRKLCFVKSNVYSYTSAQLMSLVPGWS
jgi:hypothetical protein